MSVRGAVGLVAVVAALALAPAAQAGSSRSFTATPTGGPGDVTFTEANNDQVTQDTTIFKHLDYLIDKAPANSIIALTLHDFNATTAPVIGHLESAVNRGVKVKILNDKSGSPFKSLVSYPLRYCIYGCLSGTILPDASHLHAKFFLFSSTRRPPTDNNPSPSTALTNAVWIGSSNLNELTGSKAYNNAITYYGDSDLYNRFMLLWQDMWGQVQPAPANFDYFQPERGINLPTRPGSGWFDAPRSRLSAFISPDSTPGSDQLRSELEGIKPPLAGGGPCDIGVMQQTMSRFLEVTKLTEKAAYGCHLTVVVNGEPVDPHAEHPESQDNGLTPDTYWELCTTPNTVVYTAKTIHDKAIFARATYNNTPDEPTVWTGSQNMTLQAQTLNDEVLVRIDGSTDLYNAYVAHQAKALVGQAPLCVGPPDGPGGTD
jgi:hypothetical protein